MVNALGVLLRNFSRSNRVTVDFEKLYNTELLLA